MKSKLNTILIIFSILPLVIISLVALLFYGKKYNSESTQSLLSKAESGSKIISYLIQTQELELTWLSKQRDIIQSCSETNISSSEFGTTPIEILNDILYKNPNYTMLTLYNSNGTIIISTNSKEEGNSYPGHPLIQSMSKNRQPTCTYIPPNYYIATSNSTPYIEIGAPILSYDKTQLIGYIALSMKPQYFNNYLDILQLGESNCAFISDKEGKRLFAVSLADKAQKQEDFSSTFSHTRNGSKLSGIFSMGSFTSKIRYGYYYLDQLDWYFIVTQNTDLIHTIYSYTISITLLCVCCLLIAILITSRKIAQKFTSPLLALRDCMRQAADGNLTILCNVKSKDEFGDLSRSFNKMLHIIKSNYDELSFIHKKLLVKEEQLRSNYEHIEFLAYHDSLTKLPNKAAFYDYLNITLSNEPGNTQTHAIYFIDLDNFKNVNDTLGHDYGDELLIHTAKRLNCFLRNHDLLARAGGDEFLFFKMNIASQEEAVDTARAILDKFKEPICINGTYIYISISVGISLYPINGDKYTTLVKHADIAMYRSKDNGKNQLTLFDDSMQQEINRHTEILEILRHAIENKEIYLVYQPQFDLSLERIIGFEALMRIKNPKLGYLSPSEFIPIAEDSGMINDLGSWALYEACRFNKQLQNSGFPYCTVAVNISTIQLKQKGFIHNVMNILKSTQLSPQFLELEITESTIVSSLSEAVSILEELQGLGIRLSLDDFGTGYSSLNYLTQMPINTLKIDKAFIDKLNKNQKDNYIAEAIISLAHNLEVKVIAEGVEDCEQLRLLREKQCDLIQGFLYSKPLEAQDLINIL